MASKVQELQEQLRQARIEEFKDKASKWLEENEKFVKNLVGKTLINHDERSHTNHIYILKVASYKKITPQTNSAYDVGFELTFEGPFGLASIGYSYGKPSVKHDSDEYGHDFRLINEKKKTGFFPTKTVDKTKKLIMLPITRDIEGTPVFNDTGYSTFSYYLNMGIAPEGLFEEIQELYNKQANEAFQIFEKYNKSLKSIKRYKDE